MSFSINPGIWPVMITPWTDDNKPDFKAIENLTNWYIEKGCKCLDSRVYRALEIIRDTDFGRLEDNTYLVDGFNFRFFIPQPLTLRKQASFFIPIHIFARW